MGFYKERLYPLVQKTVEANAKTSHLNGIVNGTLPIDKFKFQVRQNYNYLIEYAKSWATGLARCHDYDTMAIWAEIVNETIEHEIPFYRSYWKEKLGLSVDDLENEVMSLVKRSYTSHEVARSWEGDLAEQVTALLPCDLVYWEQAKYLLPKCTLPEGNLYRDWLTFYTKGWFAEVCEKLIVLIDRLVENKTERELSRIIEIFAISCNYEHISWDMYFNTQTWPLADLFPKKFTEYENPVKGISFKKE